MNRRALLTGLSAVVLTGPAQANPVGAAPSRRDAFLAAAHEQTRRSVTYDGTYTRIPYPMGDVAPDKGVCTDVVIRAYRAIGIDLQQRVHEDMAAHFALYPRTWGLKQPDSNIDHRRVPNLRVFLSRFGQALPVTTEPGHYAAGDLVTYRILGKMPHIAVVSDRMALLDRRRPLIIHNIGWGPKEEDSLFMLGAELTGHYRYAV
ncbi:hypothetical protein AEAC466_18735 [Asticcacaulis sp. AC466]|uniref:DUF1287 domain-containing protein n=1 Tax=Asticcacaulis sp. AC466 TaxID=1282362 RepID=UPI0003C404C0|nr:DUF1287 domain-containing protein [Asticcacaulis sp. AC466]ESQ82174.1 hypothetical protein AEAC466_18735 [Asticcacaulis sp. AC466]